MNPKILLPIVLLLVGGFVGKTMFAKPVESKPKPKVYGEVYVMPREFLINLKDGRFAKLNIALILKPYYLAEALQTGGGAAPPKAPDGYGPLPQEAIVRDIITDELTGAAAADLISKTRRQVLKEHILKRIKKSTDVKVQDVMFTDVTIQ